MPNWCDTTYIFTGKKETIQHLFNIANKDYDAIITNIWLDMGYDDISEDVDAQYKLWGTKWDISNNYVDMYNISDSEAELIIAGCTAWGTHDFFIQTVCEHYKIRGEIIGLEPGSSFFYRAFVNEMGDIENEIQTDYLSYEAIEYFGIDHFTEDIEYRFDEWLNDHYSLIEIEMLKDKIDEMSIEQKFETIQNNKLLLK